MGDKGPPPWSASNQCTRRVQPAMRLLLLAAIAAAALATEWSDLESRLSSPSSGPAILADNVRARELETATLTQRRTKPLPRLSGNLIPSTYFIRIQPFFPADGVTFDSALNMTFAASSSVVFSVTNATSQFVINTRNLHFNSTKIEDISGNPIAITGNSYDATSEQYTLTLAAPLKAGGTYAAEFTYTGVINTYTEGGLYYTHYTDTEGNNHWMVATQFEVSDARSVFPSFDEPAYKATYSLTVIYPTSQVVLGNMMETKPKDKGAGWSLVQFPYTPRMSSYLVAFAVGPFVAKQYTNKAGTLVRSWGWTGQEEYLAFAAETSGDCLYQMGLWTNITFPLQKADQLGLPEFPAGAMENWGLIIYKYQYIAFNPQIQTTRNKEDAAKVMCHELAHQWFGDLVTTKWWDDLFLDEGIAEYFEWFSQGLVFPQHKDYVDSYMELYSQQNTMFLDGPNSHPVVNPLGPSFDRITYGKGASMLRMLSDTLGADVFQEGLRNYLQSHKYGSGTHEYLFQALTTAASKHGIVDWCGRPMNVSLFMEPWVLQQSFPQINVINNQNMAGAEYSQEPFFNASSLPPSVYNYSWPVPIRVADYTNATATRLEWIKPAWYCHDLSSQDRVHYVAADYTAATYARFRYDDIGFDRLLKKLQKEDLPTTVKIALINDEVAFMQKQQNAGQPFSYNRLYSIIKAVVQSPSFVASPSSALWESIKPQIDALYSLIADSTDGPMVDIMFRDLFTPVYGNRSFTHSSSWDISTFRASFLPYAVRFGVGDAANQSLALFANLMQHCSISSNGSAWCNTMYPDTRRAVYCGAAKYGGKTAFAQLLRLYMEEARTNPYFYQEYQALLEGAACTTEQAAINVYVKHVLNNENLDADMAFGFLNANAAAGEYAMELMSNIVGDYKSSPRLVPLFRAIMHNWRSNDRVVQVDGVMQLLQVILDYDIYVQIKAVAADFHTKAKFYANYKDLPIRWIYDNCVVIGRTPWQTRIPTGVIQPHHYDVSIQPYFPSTTHYPWQSNLTFDGVATMHFTALSRVSSFSINAHRLIISSSYDEMTLLDSNGTQIFIIAEKDYANGIANLHLYKYSLIPNANYTLSIVYRGFIFAGPNEGVDTNYDYNNWDGKISWIFTTDFEGGPGVRSMIPCLDEPVYKAVWNITIKHPSDMVALGNMPEQQTAIGRDGWTVSTFAPTPKMSSYLIALCVGHFSSLNTVTKDGVLVRMWAWTGEEAKGEVAMNVMAGTLEFMSSYFDTPFALPKLDMVALPQYSDNAGAMENWGLVLGEYEIMLVDPDSSKVIDYSETAETAAHETVHQWFGDLVTMDWWSDIFLNEGFAQYWYANGITNTFPEQADYSMAYNRFEITDIALEVDCTPGYAKPVISNDPPVFGVEPYYKGSALLNLLSNTLSAGTLQKGLRYYLKANQFSMGSPESLWASLSRAAKEDGVVDWNGNALDVATFMHPYTLNTSYPIIRTSTNNGIVSYTQQSCMNNNVTWYIPLHSQSQHSNVSMHWFTGPSGSNSFWSRAVGSAWQVDNVAASSFARVLYDDQTWQPILAQLLADPTAIDQATRASLLSDMYNFARLGLVSYSAFLDLTRYLVKESELMPWRVAAPALQDLVATYKTHSAGALLNKYILSLLTADAPKHTMWKATGKWSNDSLSARLSTLACQLGSTDCRDKAQSMFASFQHNCGGQIDGVGVCARGLSPDLRAIAYCEGVRANRASFYSIQTFYDYYQKLNVYFKNDATALLNALTCTDGTLLTSMIRNTLNGKYPVDVLGYVANNDDSAMALYSYLLTYPSSVILGVTDFSAYVDAMVQGWSSEQQAMLLDSLLTAPFSSQFSPFDKQSIKKAAATVRSNAKWIAAHPDIQQWLTTHVQ